MTTPGVQPRPAWSTSITRAVRRLGVVTLAGAVAGVLVGGVGGRLAMLVLARLNPEVEGRQSDDDFTMGQISGATFNLLFFAMLIGIVGGAIYLVLRGLMVGPRWFRLSSMSVGPAVVVGSQVVHTDGIDFTLDPPLLAVAMFVLIPGLYAALLIVLSERWLDDGSRLLRSPGWVAGLPLLLWIPLAPLLLPLALGFLALEALRRTDAGATVLARPVWPNVARGLLAVVFALSLVGLIQDTATLA
jgi:hypothetical protein